MDRQHAKGRFSSLWGLLNEQVLGFAVVLGDTEGGDCLERIWGGARQSRERKKELQRLWAGSAGVLPNYGRSWGLASV